MAIRKRLNTEQKLQRLRALVGDAEALLEETADPSMQESDEPSGGGTHIHIHTNGNSGQGGEPEAGAMPDTLTQDEPGGEPGAGGDIESRVAALETGMKQVVGSVSEILAHIKGNAAPSGGDADPDMTGDPDDGEPQTQDEFPDGEEEQAAKTGDELPVKETATAHKTGDSAALSRSYQQLLSDAEVLVPGFRAPTFDAKATRAKTVDRMCALRRKALDAFYMTSPGKTVVDALTGKSDITLEDMPCGPVATLFKSAAGAQRLINNRATTGDSGKLPEQVQETKKTFTNADLNKQNAAFWANRH